MSHPPTPLMAGMQNISGPPRNTKWMLLTLPVAGLTLLFGLVGSRLTFYAEDYDFFLNQAEFGPEVLVFGSNGHWFPVSRAVLWVESLIFGTWYGGYIALNALLLAVGLCAFAFPLMRRSELVPLLVPLTLLQVALVPQIMSVVLVASNLPWVLSFALAGLAALCLDGQKMVSATFLMVLSFFAMTGLSPFWALLVVGISAFSGLGRIAFRKWVVASSGFLVLSFLIFYTGRLAAIRWDSPFFAPYFNIEVETVPVSAASWTASLFNFGLLVVTWTFMTAWPASMGIVHDLPTRLGFLLVDYPAALLGAVVLIVTLGLFVMRSVRAQRATLGALTLMTLPVAAWALAVVFLRSDELFAPRYAMVWLPACLSLLVAATWAVYSIGFPNSRVRLETLFWVVAMSSAAALIVVLPHTLPWAADIGGPRWDKSVQQIQISRECANDEVRISGLSEISPYPTDRHLCDLTRYLENHSLLAR